MFRIFKKRGGRLQIPGLGAVVKDERFGWYYSDPLPLALLNGQLCRIGLEDYDEDEAPHQFHETIANLLTAPFSVLRAAEQHVFQYYLDVNDNWDPSDAEYVSIASPSEVWQHIGLDAEPMVTRRAYGDRGIYVSLECSCAWEPEHGLQIVLKDGNVVNKVGPYDGHLTNSDAYADAAFENVIYLAH
ncbi:hypothetical protein LF41_1125 [Lysobacter dokdonensis DS-58]|uniref:DUF6985 domain-containing protein n=1 Tax=Lysobacter dokdonensis DS-58 TaxID=1300345 RepID=A0A0A2WLC2_9GAMM|nr:hypothetical protein [Lysobacter dokdonensis]KGQ20588.1 hypothetical protein LF41_1125 [Lysobacter dokdonensis DS-58]